MLTITHFQKKYPGNPDPVLSIPQLNLAKGIYWIRGENGSGKTSLMKCIAGLLPFEGGIEAAGLNIDKQRMEYTRIVNYAEAEPLYPPFLTGEELIDFYKATKGGNLPNDLIKALGVDKFMQQKTAVYSSGMLKKLSLVMGFTGDPTLILLDEPLIALDVAAVEVLQNCIKTYQQNGVSFIITSHQPMNDELMAITTTLSISNKTLQPEN
jgi:ABC-2 type transport system ATP-binding protein